MIAKQEKSFKHPVNQSTVKYITLTTSSFFYQFITRYYSTNRLQLIFLQTNFVALNNPIE